MSSVNLQSRSVFFSAFALSTSSPPFGPRRRAAGSRQRRRAERDFRCLKSLLFNLRETDCYSWHEQGSSHSEVYGPLWGLTVSPGISVSRNDATAKITAARSAQRRVVPWGPRSPLRSKELRKFLA